MRPHWRGRVSAALAAALASALIGSCTVTTTEAPRFEAPPTGEGENFAAYVAGRFADETGDPRAADFLLEAARRAPDNPAILNRAFLALITAGRFSEAVEVAADMERQGATNSIAALVLALDAFGRQDYDRALAWQARIGGGGFEALISPILEAWILALKGDRVRALDALDPLRAMVALRPFALAHRAYILDYLGDEDGAKAAYREVLEGAQLSSLQPVLSYAAFLQRRGESTEALALIEKYALLFRDSAYLDRTRNRLLASQPIEPVTRTPQGAVGLVLFRAASELDRQDVHQPAIVYARLAMLLTPQSNEARLRLSGMLADAGFYDAALGVLDPVGRDDGDYAMARLQAAWIYQRSGNIEAAIGALTDFLASHPDNVRGWATLGDIYRSEERFREAARAYTRAIALLPQSREVEPWFLYFTRGIAYERLGEWAIAEADLLKALELNPDEPQLLNYLGYSWIDRGLNLERGTELIEKAASLRPNDGFIVDSLGWAYYLRGAYADAVTYLERAVELEPTDPTINDHLGDAYWQVGRHMEARFQWRHALTFKPEKESERRRIAEKLEYGLEFADAGTP